MICCRTNIYTGCIWAKHFHGNCARFLADHEFDLLSDPSFAGYKVTQGMGLRGNEYARNNTAAHVPYRNEIRRIYQHFQAACRYVPPPSRRLAAMYRRLPGGIEVASKSDGIVLVRTEPAFRCGWKPSVQNAFRGMAAECR